MTQLCLRDLGISVYNLRQGRNWGVKCTMTTPCPTEKSTNFLIEINQEKCKISRLIFRLFFSNLRRYHTQAHAQASFDWPPSQLDSGKLIKRVYLFKSISLPSNFVDLPWSVWQKIKRCSFGKLVGGDD